MSSIDDYERPDRYHIAVDRGLLRMSPAAADELAKHDPEAYLEYVGRSCDLTMRGGTTSGVIYPLAVCALAEHYVFRNVGGASAGAIGAAATAAAEYGRHAEPAEPVTGDAVRPGFAGLAGMIQWLVSGTGADRWRLPALFQPKPALHKAYRLFTALLQSPATTGRRRFTAVFTALLFAVKPLATFALLAMFALWLVGPYSLRWVVPPSSWNGSLWIVAIPLAVLVVAAAAWAYQVTAARFGKMTLFFLVPLALGFGGIPLYDMDASGWFVAGAVLILFWLVLTFGMVAAFAVIYGVASWPLVMQYRKHRFGVVPGAMEYSPGTLDRMSGMPSAKVPPLVTWLADRIDDLAGIDHRRALTFGDLWRGPGKPRVPDDPEYCPDVPHRVINLALMTTDLNAGRPHQLPFPAAERWQFCPECLRGLVPDRIITQMSTVAVDGTPCPEHKSVTLQWLPQPCDMPVVLAARMSLPLPGLISPIPLYRNGTPHWFSDGGITSNFPIHFFDSLLPRWPTFGLNLTSADHTVKPGQIHLPDQDASQPREPYNEIGDTALSFAGRILNTFLDWRDTMQSALPGFRGRIATIPQGPGEGGTNLFMSPEVIERLALRGRDAGNALRQRFTAQYPDEEDGFTRTDRYRWIRLRLALREWREVALQADARSPLYKERTAHYPIPAAMRDWFVGPVFPPVVEPHAEDIVCAYDHFIEMAGTCLADEFDGAAPVDPVMRLTPQE
ncbi:patatin-like phospholipase family protein [Kibdelosporangium persicum]|uniref:RpoH suppressor n=1 Tax=Kibdelosporangium persicum TaxID=2698649 RepID=A0ABX2F348_9PSEU|nr:patatin-like phospholipase family protein [Kibdelosporangium persicum]NRN65293.1 RpoH suppressor [Kibdelosporangium persicum]